MSQHFNIGKIAGIFGLKGELIVVHSLGKKTDLRGLEVIFLEINKGELLPYFIRSCRGKSETELQIELEGIDSREAARALIKKPVWLQQEAFYQFTAGSSPLTLLGYQIVADDEPLGEILEIIEQPQQLLCRLMINRKEVLIPLHEETLDKIDKKKRIVYVSLPDGLLDVYLG